MKEYTLKCFCYFVPHLEKKHFYILRIILFILSCDEKRKKQKKKTKKKKTKKKQNKQNNIFLFVKSQIANVAVSKLHSLAILNFGICTVLHFDCVRHVSEHGCIWSGCEDVQLDLGYHFSHGITLGVK